MQNKPTSQVDLKSQSTKYSLQTKTVGQSKTKNLPVVVTYSFFLAIYLFSIASFVYVQLFDTDYGREVLAGMLWVLLVYPVYLLVSFANIITTAVLLIVNGKTFSIKIIIYIISVSLVPIFLYLGIKFMQITS